MKKMELGYGKVSIIVPVYNMDKLVSKCVESLITQSYENVEVVIINDGSTDRSGEICDRYADGDTRIKVLHKNNGGVADATNYGLDNMTGDFVLFVDSDDYISSDMIETLLKELIDNDADIVQCGRIQINENCEVLSKEKTEDRLITGNNNVIKTFFTDDVIPQNLACKVFKAKLFAGVRLKKGRNIADVSVLPELLHRCERYKLVDNTFYYNLQTKNSVTRGEITEREYEDIKYSLVYLEGFITKYYSENLKWSEKIVYRKVYEASTCYYKIKRSKLIKNKHKKLAECRLLFKQNYKAFINSNAISYATRNQRILLSLFNLHPAVHALTICLIKLKTKLMRGEKI